MIKPVISFASFVQDGSTHRKKDGLFKIVLMQKVESENLTLCLNKIASLSS